MVLVVCFFFYSPLSSFIFNRSSFSSSSLSAIRLVLFAYLRVFFFFSLGNLDFSLSFIQPSISHTYRWNNQSDNIQPWMYSFPTLSQLFVPCLVLTVAFWLAYRVLRRQVRWSDIPISLVIFYMLSSTQSKTLSILNEADVDIFLWNSVWSSRCWHFFLWLLCFFLNSACICGSSQFMLCWSLAWRILSITMLALEMSTTAWQFKHSLALLFFGIEMKTDLFQSCWHLCFWNLLS